ncbi:MAG TPA: hypothetical protein VNG93_04010 [Candidatus Dormibacteraeota bacterium]|nr:hypothetical protein [Candidatus Dormibacteraeota bacterium]
MGKKRAQVRQVKKTMRQVRPKASSAPPGGAQQRRQRERYVEAGGFLQGYSPEWVIRLGYYSLAAIVFCLLVIAELIWGPLAPTGLPVKIIAAVAWLAPIVILVSLIGPGVRLAFKDRRAQPLVVQGQLLGASSVSTSRGLGMLMIRTRSGTEQYLCPPEKLAKVPGNVVQVAISVTPSLRYVRSVSVMGQRQMARPEPPVPEVLQRLQLLPLLTPAALAAAFVLGDDVTAFIPLYPVPLHAAAAAVVGVALGAGVFGLSYFYQKRLTAQAQALVPGAA